MAATSLLTLSSLLLLVLLLAPATQAQGPSAPSPAPSGPFNLTAFLEKSGQYTLLIKLLTSTQVGNQIENQFNNSKDGMTLFVPTDNAFNNLKAGTLNTLNAQELVLLVQYHILPKSYKLSDLPLVSNPVRTQASGQDGKPLGLNFTSRGNKVNVSTGVVETQINNALRQEMPLAVYQVDKVLLPNELFGTKYPSPPAAPPAKTLPEGSKPTPSPSAAPPPKTSAEGSKPTPSPSAAPSAKTSPEGSKLTPSPSATPPIKTSPEESKPMLSDAKEPASEDTANAGGRINADLGIVGGLALLCMGVLS